MDKIYICDMCDFQTTNGKIMSNHKRWKHKTDKNSEKYKLFQAKLSEAFKRRIKWIKTTCEVECPECGATFMTTKEENKLTNEVRYSRHYCSTSCAHKQGSKFTDYKKVAEWQKAHPSGCFSLEWKINHPEFAKNFSKRELEIVNYFKTHFPEDEWKQGFINGSTKVDGFMINPDLWSKKLKVVIEYDGIWHFKDIHGQLERKQNADKATLKFCKENGYRLIRIDEDLNISNEIIENEVYNNKNELQLFGSERYNYLFE
jgi:hypothetical protein